MYNNVRSSYSIRCRKKNLGILRNRITPNNVIADYENTD